MNKFRMHIAAGLLSLSWLLFMPLGLANNPSGKTPGVYNYFFNRSLDSVLRGYAKSQGEAIQMSRNLSMDTLKQTVNGRFVVNTPAQLLDKLSGLYGFDWFEYSGTLYITNSRHISRSVAIDAQSINNALQYLQNIKLDKYTITPLPNENKIMVSGSDEYVNLVISKINQLDLRPQTEQFITYRLKYASAQDIIFYVNNQPTSMTNGVVSNQNITIPGVATILQTMLSGGPKQKSGGYTPIANQVTTVNKDNIPSESEVGQAGSDGRNSMPLIQADARTNSIIIKDKQSNFKVYENLLKSLDVPTSVVQVDVYTISVNQSKLNQLGSSWGAAFGNIGGGFNTAGLNQAFAFIGGGANPVSNGTIVTDVNGFVLGLRFLTLQGYAKTVSRPSLLTVDNMPAIMSSNETYYMNTNGGSNPTNAGNPTNVNIGQVMITTSLTIIPHVVNEATNKNSKLELNISIQDGGLNAQQITNSVAAVTQGNINTQAVLLNGQALLMAGYSRDGLETVQSKVPVLGDIPLLGWLFKSERSSIYEKRVYYLVVPKILDVNNLANAEVVKNNFLHESGGTIDTKTEKDQQELINNIVVPVNTDENTNSLRSAIQNHD